MRRTMEFKNVESRWVLTEGGDGVKKVVLWLQ